MSSLIDNINIWNPTYLPINAISTWRNGHGPRKAEIGSVRRGSNYIIGGLEGIVLQSEHAVVIKNMTRGRLIDPPKCEGHRGCTIARNCPLPTYILESWHVRVARSRTCVDKASTLDQRKQTRHLCNGEENPVMEYRDQPYILVWTIHTGGSATTNKYECNLNESEATDISNNASEEFCVKSAYVGRGMIWVPFTYKDMNLGRGPNIERRTPNPAMGIAH